MLENISVDKTDHRTALFVQPGRTRQIILDLFCVRFPINLHHQPASSAIEIHDEGPNRMLSAKFEATQLPIAQMRPQFLFRGRLWLAQLASASQDGWVDAVLLLISYLDHLLMYCPSPQPSPRRGEGAFPLSLPGRGAGGEGELCTANISFTDRPSPQPSPRRGEGVAPLSLPGRGAGGEGKPPQAS